MGSTCAAAENPREDAPPRGPERHSDSNFAGALGGGKRDHAVETDERQTRRHDREQSDQADRETVRRELVLDVVTHHAHLRQGYRPIEARELLSDPGHEPFRRAFGADDDVHLPVRPGPSPGVEVDGLRWRISQVGVTDILDHTDDLERFRTPAPGVGGHTAPDRVPACERSFGEVAADDDDVTLIRWRESTASDEGHTQGLE